METFTLVVWLMMGWRFEEVQIPGLSSTECLEQVIKIVATQRRIGQCIGVGRPVKPEQDRLRDCATHHYFRGSCVWPPPPGHKRVEAGAVPVTHPVLRNWHLQLPR